MIGRAAAVVAVLCLLAACDGAPVSAVDLDIVVTADAVEVEFGKVFTVTVQRVWRRDHVADEWRDRALEPLAFRALAIERREDGERVLETRRFECRAFVVDSVTVPALTFKARAADGTEREATSEAVTLLVRSALDDGSSKAAEMPSGPLPAPRSLWRLAALLFLTVVAAWAIRIVVLRRRRRAPIPEPLAVVPAADPTRSALDRLAALRRVSPADAAAIDAFHVEVSSILRDWLAARLAIPAPLMTTRQVRASADAARLLSADRLGVLCDLLAGCDVVKFSGRSTPSFDAALTITRATRLVDPLP